VVGFKHQASSIIGTRHSKIVKNHGILALLSADNDVTRRPAWISI